MTASSRITVVLTVVLTAIASMIVINLILFFILIFVLLRVNQLTLTERMTFSMYRARSVVIKFVVATF